MLKRLKGDAGTDRPPPRNDASEDERRYVAETARILQVKWWRYRHLFLPIKQRELALRQEGGQG